MALLVWIALVCLAPNLNKHPRNNAPTSHIHKQSLFESKNRLQPGIFGNGTEWNGVKAPVYWFGYSAYLDDRLRGGPYIAVIGINEHRDRWYRWDLGCQFWGVGGKQIGKKVRSYDIHTVYATNDFTSDGTWIDSFVIHCKLGPGLTLPAYVSLSHPSKGGAHLCNVSVQIPPKPAVKKDIKLCVGKIYNAPQCDECQPMDYSLHLVPWLEMQRMLGVSSITIYNHSMPTDASHILEYYKNMGYVEVVRQGPIDGDNYRQPGSVGINDCMYKHMHSYHKIMMMDIDELIIPTDNITLMEVIKSAALQANEPFQYSQFCFANTLYYTDYQKFDMHQPERFQMLRYRHHSPPEKFPGGCKAIIEPQICFIATLHLCMRHFDYVDMRMVGIDPRVATMHHYKDCAGSWWRNGQTCSDIFREMQEDNVIMEYEQTLRHRVYKEVYNIHEGIQV